MRDAERGPTWGACLVLATACLAMAAPTFSQSAGSVADVQTEIVRLEAVVTDADGNRVRDLGKDDFELSEDGKRQTLTHFQLTGPEDPSLSSGEPGTAESPAPGRHVVILVDDLHIGRGGLVSARAALKRVADALVTENDRVALLRTASPGASYAFAQGRAGLLAMIETLESSSALTAQGLASDMTPATAELILRGDRGALRLATRGIIDDPTTFSTSSGPRAALTARHEVRAGIDPSDSVAADEAQRQARAVLLDALRFSAATLGTLEDVVWGLSPLPGRKICVLVSDGFLVGAGTSVELSEAMRRVVSAALRSGTVVYALDSEGVASTSNDAGVSSTPSSPGLQQRVAVQGEIASRKTLKAVAGGTGGFLVRGSEDFEGRLRAMSEDAATHYVLAYEPSNARRQGKFRKIEVGLPGRDGLTVRTRQGYLEPDDRDPDKGARVAGSLAGSVSDDAIRALLDGPAERSGIPVQLSAGFLSLPPAGAQALVRANVDLHSVTFREQDRRHHGTVDVMGGLYDAFGEPVGATFRSRAALDWNDSEHERGLEAGLAMEQALPLAPGRYQVRLLVQDPRTARTGGARQWVDIPDLDNAQLAMSSVFLGSEEQAAQGVRRFGRDESLSFQLYVYNPLVDEDGSSDVVFQPQIWSGGETIAASQPEPVVFGEVDGPPAAQGNSFPLAGLEPGGYELKVVVVDRKAQATVSSSTEFTVE